jgi:hypothetical protein
MECGGKVWPGAVRCGAARQARFGGSRRDTARRGRRGMAG